MLVLLASIFFLSAQVSYAQIDFHTHVNSQYEAEMLLKSMDRNGIEKSVILSGAYYKNTFAEAAMANDLVNELSSIYPDRFLGSCSVSVTKEWYLKEAVRCFHDLKLRGLKLHFASDEVSIDSTGIRDRFEALAAVSGIFSAPIIIHLKEWSSDEIRDLLRLAFQYPSTRFIIAHAMGTQYRLLLDIADYMSQKGVPKNIYIETSRMLELYSGSPEMEDIAWYMGKFGWERVLWGSDWFLGGYSQSESLDSIKHYPFKADEFDLIFERNAKIILSL